MAWTDRFRLWGKPPARAQASDAGRLVTTPQELEQAMRGGAESKSGVAVNAESAMRTSVVFRCVNLIAGTIATMPLDLKRRIDTKTREDASDHSLWEVLKRKPNRWQKPAQFRRMMEAQKLLHGNAFALIVRVPTGKRQVTELIPFRPGSIDVKQRPDLSLEYHYSALNGTRRVFQQHEVFHLMGLTLDGIRGVSPIRYARESIGSSLAMEEHGSNVFRNGAQVSGVLEHPSQIGDEAHARLKASMQAYRNGGGKAGETLILEEGMSWNPTSLNMADAQWIEGRKFSRVEIATFYGVPPHLVGEMEKSTTWGAGLEQQTQGFITYTLEDHLTTWEETVNADLIDERDVYAKFNRSALVKGDIKARWEAYVKSLQWGVNSPNEIRALEDQDPREGGDIYYDPPNTAGGNNEVDNEPSQSTQTASV